MKNVRNFLVDGQSSVGQHMRTRRWDWFRTQFPDIEHLSVIDLGGTAEAWLRAPVRPASVHVVNLEPDVATEIPTWIKVEQGDACDLPSHIKDATYDLVFSNSVLEHVGGHAQRMRFADAVHKLANLHWVQTPYRYFPVEPHWLFPGFQFLPLTVRARVSATWPLAHTKSANRHEGLDAAMSVELLSRSEMAYYFPSSVIYPERMIGMTKSLIAIRTNERFVTTA